VKTLFIHKKKCEICFIKEVTLIQSSSADFFKSQKLLKMTTAIFNSPSYNLSEIFSKAWETVKQKGITLSEALRMAWDNAKKALSKLNFDMAKLSELSIEELTALKDSINSILEKKNNQNDVEMCHEIKLEVKNDKVYTTSYYNSEFVSKARGLQGKWDSGKWVFPISIIDHVRKAMVHCYGVTGENPYPVCVLACDNLNLEGYQSGVELFGRPIAKASGRDSGARLQDHVIKISGNITSGGSMKNWYTYVKNACIEIHKFPVAALERADVKSAIAEGWCTVK